MKVYLLEITIPCDDDYDLAPAGGGATEQKYLIHAVRKLSAFHFQRYDDYEWKQVSDSRPPIAFTSPGQARDVANKLTQGIKQTGKVLGHSEFPVVAAIPHNATGELLKTIQREISAGRYNAMERVDI